MDEVGLAHPEGLADVVDGNGEDGRAHRNLHAVHDGHGQRNLQRGGHALARLAGDGDGAAHVFHVLFHHVHAHAAAGKLRHLRVGGEARRHQEVQDVLVGILHVREGQAVADGLLQHAVVVDALAVVLDFDDDLAAGVAGGEGDFPHRILAGVDPVLGAIFNAVVHGVADNVHNRVADGVHNGLVHLGLLANQGQLGLLAQLLGHIAHNPVHLLERAGQRHHPQGHGHVLELVGQLPQLAGRFRKGVQFQALQVRRGGDHGLGDDNLAHDGSQLVQLAQVDADEALPVVRRRRRRAAGSLGRLGRSRGGRRAFFCGRPGGRRRRRLGGRGRMVDGLVRPHGAGAGDGVDGVVPVGGVFEVEHEARFHYLGGRRRVGGHVLGLIAEVRLGAEIPHGVGQHQGPDVLHAASLVKEHLQGVGKTGRLAGRRTAGRRRRGRRTAAALNLLNEAINFLKQAVDILSKGLLIFDVLDLLAEEVDGLEQQVKELRPLLLGHHRHGLVPNDGEQVLRPVGDGHDGIEFHHGGRALDGVHDTEDGVDILLREAVLLLGSQDDAVQLLEQGVCLIEIGIQDAVVTTTHGHNLPLQMASIITIG